MSQGETSASRTVTEVTSERRWWNRFFDKYAELGIVTVAAKAAGVSRKTIYQYKKTHPEFMERWLEAEEQAIATLEDAATQRALRTSDPLLMFLLKARRPDVYRETVNTNLSGGIAVGTMSLDVCDNDELRSRLADAAASLLPARPDPLCET